MLPSDITFIDVETTGLRVTYDRIIEIGIVKVKDNKIVETYKTLLNPNMYVSPFIEQITGISKDDLENAPTFEDVKDKVYSLLENSVFVAHNVRFDYGFIKNEFKRCEMPFSTKMFCTAKLSRSLFPHFPKHNLDAIIERFGFVCKNRHRAFDDAFVLWEFYKELQKRFTQEELEKIIKTHLGSPSLPKELSKSDVSQLKDLPGVYIFYGDSETPLYVGKSKHVKSRVLSHFNSDYVSTKEMNIKNQIKHIEAIYTAGELSALIKESNLVKSMQPFYNRKLRIAKKLTVLIGTKDKDGYDMVQMEDLEEKHIANLESVLGIFPSKKRAKTVVADVAKTYKLCEKLLGLEKTNSSCFAYRLHTCKGACVKEEKPLSYNMRFVQAFTQYKVRSWPFKGPVVITEENEEGKTEQIMIDRWCLLSSQEDTLRFDYDVYKILLSYFGEYKNLDKIHQLSPKEYNSI